MKAYESYVVKLERLAAEALADPSALCQDARCLAALNGEAAVKLREVVPIAVRKAAGAFFTGRQLGDRAINSLGQAGVPDQAYRVLDPACGAGDLLLAWAAHLPTESTLAGTLDVWGGRVHGTDTQPLFVRAAKARLVLAAAVRVPYGTGRGTSLSKVFPNVRTADGLSTPDTAWAGQILLNPPYIGVKAPANCAWGTGSVSAAALFLDHYATHAQPGTRIIAILPDVLRTGERYRRWRDRLVGRAKLNRIDVYGRFDPAVDVDVFVVDLTVVSNPRQDLLFGEAIKGRDELAQFDWWRRQQASATIGDVFSVNVGPVVPHRHPNAGVAVPFLHAGNAPHWGTVRRISERRGFAGRLESPPFVVIRRTSGPHDTSRAIASVVVGKRAVAVENHLLVLRPLNGSPATCYAALKVLQSKETNAWLNERIRCRHLTVAAVREIPWPIDAD